MNLFEKLNRLDDSKYLRESTKMVTKKRLTESTNKVKLEVKYETYGRYGDGGAIKTGRVSGSTEVEALMKMLDHVHMYTDSDYAEEFKEENGRYPTTEEVVDELYSQNGDGCDLIYWIRNLTTGKMIFDGAVEDSEPEEWGDDIDEMLTEDLKDTDYVIVLTHPNMPQDKRYSYFGSNYRMTRDLNKAMTYPGKFSAKDEIKYALDATDGHWDPLYADRFSVMTVAQVKELLNAPKPEKVSRAVHHNPSAQEAAKPIAKEIHEIIKKHNVSLSSFLKLITQIIKSEDPTA